MLLKDGSVTEQLSVGRLSHFHICMMFFSHSFPLKRDLKINQMYNSLLPIIIAWATLAYKHSRVNKAQREKV